MLSRYIRLNFHKFQNFHSGKRIYNVKRFSTLSKTINPHSKKIGVWLGVLSGMVIGNVAMGGLTRLTESGLSMTNWNLFKEMPLLTEAEWLAEFARYKEFPEYDYVSSTHGEMSLEKFKFIWWMEYSHRQMGRLIGAVLVLPGAYFWYKGFFDNPMKKRFLLFGGLTMFQGLLGWYMVKSGLDKKNDPEWIPRVSQYRLAAHLGSAVVLYSLLFWNTLSHLSKPVAIEEFKQLKMLRGVTHGSKAMIFVTIMAGAIVAGLDAGMIYNSYPLMGSSVVPNDIWVSELGMMNLFENMACAQFVHRHLGELTGCMAILTSGLVFKNRFRLPGKAVFASAVLLGLTATQIALGVANLLQSVPIELASAHQINSLLVLSAAMTLSHALRRMPK